MNNYERILQGGINAFENAIYDKCTCCVRESYGKCDPAECRPSVRKWLEAEFIEPDTQERINEDATKYACKDFLEVEE